MSSIRWPFPSTLAAATSLFKSRQRLGTLVPSALTEGQREIVGRSATGGIPHKKILMPLDGSKLAADL